MTTKSTEALPREAARALEIELPKRVHRIERVSYWERGEQFGKRRAYITLRGNTSKKCWVDLDTITLVGLKDPEVEHACDAILAPWLEKMAEEDPLDAIF